MRTRPACRILGVVVLALMAGAVHATEMQITLPLEGHYRTGRYFPVRIDASGITGGSITLSGERLLPTRIQSNGSNVATAVPVLPLGDGAEHFRWMEADGEHAIDQHLHALSDDERLIAVAGIEPEAAKTLFPAQQVVVVRLDLSSKLLSPALAWESLDGIVLDETAGARVDESQLSTLLACGVATAIRSSSRPAGNWPWKREGDFWTLRYEPAGPRTVFEAGAYEPTYGWVRGWPLTVRRSALLALLLFVIVTAAASLWRSRWTWAAIVSVSLVGCGVWFVWNARQSPVLEMKGDVVVEAGGITQRDHWTWQSPLVPAECTYSAKGIAHPLFSSRRQPDTAQMQLLWGNGATAPAFVSQLGARFAIAYVEREIQPEATPPQATLSTAGPTPMAHLADALYATDQRHLAGQYPSSEESQTIVIRSGK